MTADTSKLDQDLRDLYEYAATDRAYQVVTREQARRGGAMLSGLFDVSLALTLGMEEQYQESTLNLALRTATGIKLGIWVPAQETHAGYVDLFVDILEDMYLFSAGDELRDGAQLVADTLQAEYNKLVEEYASCH